MVPTTTSNGDEISLFEKAIDDNAMFNFIVGNGDYFVLDRETGEHWPLGSYRKWIEPHLNRTNGIFSTNIWETFSINVEFSSDKNMFLDCLIAYLIPYYFEDNEARHRKKNTPSSFIYVVKFNYYNTEHKPKS